MFAGRCGCGSCLLAGHLALNNLTILYDSNDVTLDAMADASQSESVIDRFAAYGFAVERIEDGHDMAAISAALERARANTEKPTFIEIKTIIGKGIPEVAGTSAGHGEGGAKFAEAARQGLGLPEETFYVSDEVRAFFADRKEQHIAQRKQWDEMLQLGVLPILKRLRYSIPDSPAKYQRI